MSSDRLDPALQTGPAAEGLSQLLDLTFGLFVWAFHFLLVYVSTAIVCARFAAILPSSRMTLLTVLALVTIAAIATVLFHALRRYRQQREMPDKHFRMAVTIGCDAIAAIAIAWQLFPILLVPQCA
jgi:hypothetical protein